MRLRVTVQRHELPEVRHLFNTTAAHGPGKQRIETVAELVSAVNTVVPLESSDGEWGLEEYLVEVNNYECLHYQELKDVLRDDDEVVIRGVTTNEIKERRNGGRLQITADGRHLIDGVCWGRRFKPGFGRPEVYIPPRKKRRLLADESDNSQLALPALPEAPPAVSEAIAFIDNKGYDGGDGEDDDEDDEEYEDEEDADDDYESIEDDSEDVEEEEEDYDAHEDATEVPTVNARAEDSQDLPLIPEESERQPDDVGGVDPDEELDTPGHQHRGRKRKRARIEELLNEVIEELEPSFAGFSSPAKLSQQELAYPVAGTIEGDHDIIHLGKHVVEQKKTTPNHHATSISGSDSSDDEADDFQTDGTLEQPEYRAFEHRLSELRNGHASNSGKRSDNEAEGGQGDETVQSANHSVKKKPLASKDDDTSSSESDSSDDDNEDNGHATSLVRGKVQRKQPDADDTSSSGSEVDSDSDSDSSSAEDSSSEESSDSGESSSSSSIGDSPSSVGSKKKATNGESLNKTGEENGTIPDVQPPSNLAPTQRQQQATNLVPRQVVKASAPPGHGQLKTKRNNERKKLNKLMTRLKEEGKIHENANFEELKAYLREHGGQTTEPEPPSKGREQVDAEADEMEARKKAIFQRLNAAASSEPEAAIQAYPAAAVARAVEQAEEMPTEVPVTEETEQPTVPQVAEAPPVREEVFSERPTEEPSEKRARLDMASSRRMVFNALGVRTPKTAAAEQALREKLAKPSRQVKAKEVKQQAETMSASVPLPADTSHDRWKKKLTVGAVECVSRHKHIEVPPFPFKHPWQVKKEKEEAREAGIPDTFLQYDDPVEEDIMQDMYEDEAMDDKQPSQSVITSRTLTAGDGTVDDDMLISENFDDLPVLKQTDLAEGAVVAYRQLHMNDRFEPEESPYRVARIIAKNGNQLQLQLASKYRDPVDTQYDAETGERIYSKFDMPMSQSDHDEVDDGVREISFDQLIRPKLVAPSETANVVVAESQRFPPQASANGSTSNELRLRGGFIEDSITSRVVESQTDIDTPRRVEISGIIKEAGFDSALDEQLLQPLKEPEPVSVYDAQAREDHEQEQPQDQIDETQNTINHWSSSPNPVSSQFHALADSSAIRESSVPSESMVDSVRYPNLSQLGLDTPSVNVQSSSHQDAQRLTPTPAIDTSVMLKSNLREDSHDAVGIEYNNDQGSSSQPEHDSLPSEASQTQPEQQEEETESQDRGKGTRAQGKAGRTSLAGLDGYVSAGKDSDAGPSDDDESLDSNGFPSLRALTSSQKSRKLAEKKLEPERVRRSPRVNRPRDIGKPSDSLWSDDESDTHTQKQVKASASQRDTRAPRLSQIPEDTVVVDLTQSSPGEHSAKPARSTARTGGGPASAFRRSFEGLGEKNFLTRKKRSL